MLFIESFVFFGLYNNSA